MPLSSGDNLGPYEIVMTIGAGGMGQVYKARDPRLGRTVAVKVAQSDFGERFAREARAIAALSHPNVCQIYDVGPNYFVMEYIEGSPLSAAKSVRELLDIAVHRRRSGGGPRGGNRTSRLEAREHHGDARWPSEGPRFWSC